MAFLANKPFAMAPGMGLNSFFAIVVGNLAAMTGMTYVASFQAGMVIILLEGIVSLFSKKRCHGAGCGFGAGKLDLCMVCEQCKGYCCKSKCYCCYSLFATDFP